MSSFVITLSDLRMLRWRCAKQRRQARKSQSNLNGNEGGDRQKGDRGTPKMKPANQLECNAPASTNRFGRIFGCGEHFHQCGVLLALASGNRADQLACFTGMYLLPMWNTIQNEELSQSSNMKGSIGKSISREGPTHVISTQEIPVEVLQDA